MSEDISNKTGKEFYKFFFIRYGLLLAFFAVFFFLTIYGSVLSRKAWQKNLRPSIEKVLEEKEPNTWILEKYVRIENPFTLNAVCYEARNRMNGDVYKAVLLRITTFYGPLPAVFLVSPDNNVELAGIADFHGRVKTQIETSVNSVRAEYWKKLIPTILGDER